MTGCCKEGFRKVPGEGEEKSYPGQDDRAGGIPVGDRCAPGWYCRKEWLNLYQGLMEMLLPIDESPSLITRKAPLH